MISANAIALYAEEARLRQLASQAKPGEQIGTHAAAKAVAQMPPPMKAGESKDDRKARTKAAKKTGASPRYVQYAIKLKQDDPKLAKEVFDGKKTMTQAQRV